jgi:glutamate--cysteine ligase
LSLDRAQSEQAVTGVDELVGYFRSAEKPREQHRLGLEHEKLVYPKDSATAVPYEGDRGIGALLQGIERCCGYDGFREAPELPVIALTRPDTITTISLEPGGQLELSGHPAKTAREVHAENLRHLETVRTAAGPLGLRLVALGYRPFDSVASMPWMPKSRYQVMRDTLGARGGLAHQMMLMTATGQVSLDWSDEADCARKVVGSARISPLIVALYANSPLCEGKPNGFMSFRSHVWTDVDPARCGYLKSMFDGSFGYRAYVEWALDAPLLFLRRNGGYLMPKLSFRELLARGFEGKPALHSDWVDHLSTLFPEVRIKKVLEIRAADCVGVKATGALAALMRGLLYDATALGEVEGLLPKVGFAEHQELHALARREGLEGSWRGRTLGAWSVELIEIARRGLKRLDAADVPGLDVIAETAASGRSPARRVLEVWEREKDPVKVLDAFTL